MHTHTLFIASLLTFSNAWVPNPGAQPLRQHPWEDPTPRNLELPSPTPTALSEDSLSSLDATPSVPLISTIPSMTTIPYPTSSPSSPSRPPLPLHAQLMRWIKRQGAAVTNPQAAQPNQVTQVSPATTLTMMSKGKNIEIPYTQTFPAVPEQWPSASSGAIGLGTIQGQIGQSKTKRQEPMTVLAEATGSPDPGPIRARTSREQAMGDHERSNESIEKRSTGSRALVASSAMVAAGVLAVLVAL